MSLFIKFYFISSMLNRFRTLIHPSSGACDFSIVSPHWSCVLASMCVGVSTNTSNARLPLNALYSPLANINTANVMHIGPCIIVVVEE